MHIICQIHLGHLVINLINLCAKSSNSFCEQVLLVLAPTYGFPLEDVSNKKMQISLNLNLFDSNDKLIIMQMIKLRT